MPGPSPRARKRAGSIEEPALGMNGEAYSVPFRAHTKSLAAKGKSRIPSLHDAVYDDSARENFTLLKRVVRVDERAPHVGNRAAVEPQAFPGLAEAAADDVDEGIEAYRHLVVEGVQ